MRHSEKEKLRQKLHESLREECASVNFDSWFKLGPQDSPCGHSAFSSACRETKFEVPIVVETVKVEGNEAPLNQADADDVSLIPDVSTLPMVTILTDEEINGSEVFLGKRRKKLLKETYGDFATSQRLDVCPHTRTSLSFNGGPPLPNWYALLMQQSAISLEATEIFVKKFLITNPIVENLSKESVYSIAYPIIKTLMAISDKTFLNEQKRNVKERLRHAKMMPCNEETLKQLNLELTQTEQIISNYKMKTQKLSKLNRSSQPMLVLEAPEVTDFRIADEKQTLGFNPYRQMRKLESLIKGTKRPAKLEKLNEELSEVTDIMYGLCDDNIEDDTTPQLRYMDHSEINRKFVKTEKMYRLFLTPISQITVPEPLFINSNAPKKVKNAKNKQKTDDSNYVISKSSQVNKTTTSSTLSQVNRTTKSSTLSQVNKTTSSILSQDLNTASSSILSQVDYITPLSQKTVSPIVDDSDPDVIIESSDSDDDTTDYESRGVIVSVNNKEECPQILRHGNSNKGSTSSEENVQADQREEALQSDELGQRKSKDSTTSESYVLLNPREDPLQSDDLGQRTCLESAGSEADVQLNLRENPLQSDALGQRNSQKGSTCNGANVQSDPRGKALQSNKLGRRKSEDSTCIKSEVQLNPKEDSVQRKGIGRRKNKPSIGTEANVQLNHREDPLQTKELGQRNSKKGPKGSEANGQINTTKSDQLSIRIVFDRFGVPGFMIIGERTYNQKTVLCQVFEASIIAYNEELNLIRKMLKEKEGRS